ncbi:MAG: lysophospholipid acyltransferase family protein [Verrucomicrobiales bacterium]
MDTQIRYHPRNITAKRGVELPASSPWAYRPASDLTLNFFERNRSLDCERGITRRLVQGATWAAIRGYMRLAHNLRITGSRNLPTQGAFVLVANHSSHLDALALAASVPRARATDIRLLAAGDTFFSSRSRAALTSIFLNARPVWRGACGSKALGTLRGSLQRGREGSPGPITILFPEGTRSRGGEIARFKAGVGALVAGTSVPVVPVAITGAHESWPPGQSLPSLGGMSLSIGRAMTFQEKVNERCDWRQIAEELEQRVRKLAESGRRGLVDRSAPHRLAHPLTSSWY